MIKLGNGAFAQPLKLTAGGVNYSKLTAEQQKAMNTYVKSLGVPPGPPTQQGIYATPEFTGDPYPSEVLTPVEENQEPPEGWPRNPVFNAPGDVPGPPVQFGPPIEPAIVPAGEGFTGIGMPENDIFYFHPDHLGSTSYITAKNGSISQHVEYIAFGEVLFEEHSSSFSSPYLFNGKELDRETNLSYYGARYLDMKTSLWLSIDPLMEKYPNIGPYTYVANNPITFIDPDGRKIVFAKNATKEFKKAFAMAIKHLNKHNSGGIFAKLQARKETIIISQLPKEQIANGSNFDPKTKTINWDPSHGLLTNEGVIISATTILNHEGDHALEELINAKQKAKNKATPDSDYSNLEEKRVITGTEQSTAKALGEIKEGEVTRKDHKGIEMIETKDPTSSNAKNEVIITVKSKSKTHQKNDN